MLNRRTPLLIPLAALCSIAIAACGSSSSSSSSAGSSGGSAAGTSQSSGAGGASTTAADPAVEKLVPAAIKSKGTLNVAADAGYAPDEFIAPDGHTVVGMDADLSHALAAVMGLKANVSNVTFNQIIPGLAAGKYDIGASSFTDTKEREKTVDFVTYFSAGESFFTKASGGTSITSLAELCGHSVAVESTTTEQTDAQTQAKKCKAAGKGAVNVLVFPNQNAANLALASGRVQLGFADSPVAAYQVKKTNGEFKVLGQSFANAPYGLALPKHNGMAPAVLAALKVLMKNGTYTSILGKWGIQAGAVSNPTINGATS